jgi:hypothetical protein
MFIRVDLSGAQPVTTLADPDNFRAFAAVVVGSAPDPARVAEALAGLGTLDVGGEHVWLDAGAVKRLAGDAAGERWLADFENMVEFARGKGWTDEAGRVRAHLEWRDG